MVDIFALTTALSRGLVTLSPFFLLYTLATKSRSLIEISGESLVLIILSSVYFALPTLLSFNDLLSKIHILALLLACFYTINFQSRLHIPKSAEPLLPRLPESSDQSSDDSEEDAQEKPIRKVPDCIKFDPAGIVSFLISTLYSTVITGDHSLLARLVKWFMSKPNADFWSQDFPHMLFTFFILVQCNSIVLQYIRITMFHRSAAFVKANFGPGMAKKLNKPKCVWAFLFTHQIGMALMLPTLIKQHIQDTKQGNDEWDGMMRAIAAAMQLFYLLAFLLFLRFAPLPKKQDDAEAAENSQTSEINQQPVSAA